MQLIAVRTANAIHANVLEIAALVANAIRANARLMTKLSDSKIS